MTQEEESKIKSIVSMLIAVIIESNNLLEELKTETDEQDQRKAELYKAYNKIYDEFVIAGAKKN